MPEQIREALTKEIKRFIWEDTTHVPRLGMNHLEETKEEGGINLLNLKNRNEAIEIVWLRDYLNLKESRPAWAYITDILINETTPPTLNENTRSNAFLQHWKIPMRGKKAEKLGEDTLRMIKAAKKHQIAFAPINISQELRERLPSWQHLGVEKQAPQNPRSRCLAKNHESRQVKDMLNVGLSTGAPAGYLDPDPRVFGVTKPIPGPARIFSHGSPGSAGQIPAGHGYPQVYLRVTDTCRYTCADGYSNTCGLQVYLRVTNTHRYTCTDGYWRVYLQVSSSEMFIVHASDYIVYH
jgi:hypothetical protein